MKAVVINIGFSWLRGVGIGCRVWHIWGCTKTLGVAIQLFNFELVPTISFVGKCDGSCKIRADEEANL